MKLISTQEFADECDCSFENIRLKIKSGEIVPESENPVRIDSEKYDYIIKTFQNKPK